MFRKKPIPPPLEVKIPTQPTGDMAIPFMLADYPRVVLDFISKLPTIPEPQRLMIAELVSSYSSTLAEWIMDTQGMLGLMHANYLSQQVAAEFYKAVGEAVHQEETSLFEYLEKDLNDD